MVFHIARTYNIYLLTCYGERV